MSGICSKIVTVIIHRNFIVGYIIYTEMRKITNILP